MILNHKGKNFESLNSYKSFVDSLFLLFFINPISR